jgi:hypothetical protein
MQKQRVFIGLQIGRTFNQPTYTRRQLDRLHAWAPACPAVSQAGGSLLTACLPSA